MSRNVKIVKDPESPEPDEVIAKAVIELNQAVRKLWNGPLKWKTVVLLVSQASGIGIRDTEFVLNAANNLASLYLKPAK